MTAFPTNPDRHLTPEEIDESLAVMQAAFRKAGPYIVERAGKLAHTDKRDGSPVTEADVAVEKIIFDAMLSRFPDVPLYGEETGYTDDELPVTCWLVDPIDGTKSFIENIPTYTSMAVFIQDKEALAAVIYNPVTGHMYTARKGQGAYKDGVRLDLRTVALPATAHCKLRFVEPLNELFVGSDMECAGAPSGAGHAFSMVAEGMVAARFNMLGGGYIHDYAPGALLVAEAGGALVPIKEDTYAFASRSFAACHPQVESIIREHRLALRELELAAEKEA
jgi:fructose-1,6-bisphosphatase/inositol monophosphatase family enzyme